MKNFELLDSYSDINLALKDLRMIIPPDWDKNPIRSAFLNSPHREAKSILLRFNERPETTDPAALRKAYFDQREVMNYPSWYRFEHFKSLAFKLMAQVHGTRLGRVMLTWLPKGGHIFEHADEGRYAEYYDRYHYVLQGRSRMTCGDEFVDMHTGSLWWFNNKLTHAVQNSHEMERYHLIVDIRS